MKDKLILSTSVGPSCTHLDIRPPPSLLHPYSKMFMVVVVILEWVINFFWRRNIEFHNSGQHEFLVHHVILKKFYNLGGLQKWNRTPKVCFIINASNPETNELFFLSSYLSWCPVVWIFDKINKFYRPLCGFHRHCGLPSKGLTAMLHISDIHVL